MAGWMDWLDGKARTAATTVQQNPGQQLANPLLFSSLLF